MKVEYINPFLKGTTEIISQLSGLELKRGKITINEGDIEVSDIIIMIGMTGEIKGSAIISMDKEVAFKMVSTMMGGTEVNEMDDMTKSAISEVGNMIMGKSSTYMSQEGVFIDITPPTLLLGQKLSMHSIKGNTISVPYKTDYGRIMLDVMAE